jgi:hypothetical protein
MSENNFNNTLKQARRKVFSRLSAPTWVDMVVKMVARSTDKPVRR